MPIISAEPVKKLVYKIAISNHHGMIENIQISADRLYSISFIKDGNIVSFAGKIVDVVQTENCINSGYIVFDYSDDLSNKKEIIQFYRIESIKDITPTLSDIDETLTQNGKAADAKSVGDAIAKKQNTLTDIDKQNIVLTGMTSGIEWTDIQKNLAWNRLTIIKTAMDDVAVAGSQYYLGEQTDVSIVLPDNAKIGQLIVVSWYNGETASSLSITGTMLDFDFTPSANTRSEINALWDGTYWAVLSNEMIVPNEVTA